MTLSDYLYHESERGTLYCGDCLEIMPLLADKSVDLVLTSPPYNLGNNHHTRNTKHFAYDDNMPENDYQEWQVRVLETCNNVLSDSGSILYNHKNRIKEGKQISPYEWLLKTGLIIKQEVVWFNGSPNFDDIRFYPMTERIYWLAKSEQVTLKNIIKHHDLFNQSEWQAVGTNQQHTRAFPVELASNLITCFPNANLILDCFAGSGTTAVACINTKRRYILIEKEEKYCEIAKRRIESALDQTEIEL